MTKEFGTLLPYAIDIRGTMNHGYTMQVGCANFVFTDTDSLIECISRYLKDPNTMIRAYNNACRDRETMLDEGREVPTPVGGARLDRPTDCETEEAPQTERSR